MFTDPNEFVVRLRALSSTERIMIDDFTFSKVTTVAEASNVVSSAVVGNSTTLSWTNPSQFTNIVVVDSQAAVTMSPGDCVDPSFWSFSNDWSSPVTVSSQLGSGSSSEYVLYLGSGTAVTIQNLPTGGAINYTVYTQINPWSAGVSGSTSPLPVELIAFDATKESNYVQLDWVTASELNNDYFEILKSDNGVHFESIGRVAGVGTSQQSNRYSFTDFDTKSSNYYKLKQVDYDGISTYSEVIHVESLDSDIKVDMLSNEIVVDNQSAETVIYFLTNTKGFILKKGKVDTHQVIDKSSLPIGCYIFQIIGEYLKTYKFVVLQ